MVPCIVECGHGIVGDSYLVGVSDAVLGGVESFKMAAGAHAFVHDPPCQWFVERGSSCMAAGDAGKTSFAGTAVLCACIFAFGSARQKNLIVGLDDLTGAEHGTICVVDDA